MGEGIMGTKVKSEAGAGAGNALKIGLWIAQIIAAFVFCMAGFMKSTLPITQLSATIPWTGQLPEAFVRIIGLIDLAGGIGLILPALTRIQPQLTVLAAWGCIALQIFAVAFHISRGETMVLPINFVLISLSLFIAWGRNNRARIAPRSLGRA